MEEQEIWRDVEDWEGIYQISNIGRVKSFNTNGRNGSSLLKPKEIIRKLDISTNGYERVELRDRSIKKKYPVHRLVAKAFIPNPENKPFVNHLNGIKTDNRVENLEWCTDSENCQHAIRTGLKDIEKKCLLTREQAEDIFKRRKIGKERVIDLVAEYGVGLHIVKTLLKGKTWKHLNLKERFEKGEL